MGDAGHDRAFGGLLTSLSDCFARFETQGTGVLGCWGDEVEGVVGVCPNVASLPGDRLGSEACGS